MPQEERSLFHQPKKKSYGLPLFYLLVILGLAGLLTFILPPWIKQLQTFAEASADTQTLPTIVTAPTPKIEPGILSDQQTQVSSIAQVPSQGGWINTEPLDLPALAASGHYVLIYFWSAEVPASYRANRQVEAWWNAYKDHGLIVIGVHTPKYGVDSNPKVVLDAVKAQGLTFPILLDGKGAIAKTFNNYSWPGWQVMNPQGNIILTSKGEGRYADAETMVRTNLANQGWRLPTQLVADKTLIPSRNVVTPDLYLGASFVRRQLGNGVLPPVGKSVNYILPSTQDTDSVYLDGTWKGAADYLESQSPAAISVDYFASTVYLTLASATHQPVPVLVLLDGQPVPQALAGPDLIYQNGQSYLMVNEAKVYLPLIEHRLPAQHNLVLKTNQGLRAYALGFARFDQ